PEITMIPVDEVRGRDVTHAGIGTRLLVSGHARTSVMRHASCDMRKNLSLRFDLARSSRRMQVIPRDAECLRELGALRAKPPKKSVRRFRPRTNSDRMTHDSSGLCPIIRLPLGEG